MNTTFKPGDRVYYIQEDNEVYDGIVHCLYHANDPDLSEHIMLKTLLQSQPYAIAPAADVFFNLRPAMSEAKARKKRQLQQYKNEIKNLQDLISFPLHHDLNQNGMAREAYLARAEELGYAPV